jgi:putative acetyltransferase
MSFEKNDRLISIRPIRPGDNGQIEQIVRTAMQEFNANPRTTIIGDPALKTMFENFQKPRSAYFIAEVNGEIAGGCGVSPLDGGDEDTCELQRMFLLKQMRRLGIGKSLLELSIATARQFRFDRMYIETLSDMHSAISLYLKNGFERIEHTLGQTGHSGCNLFMIKKL